MVSRNPRQKKLPSSVQFASIAVLALFVIVSLSSQEASISGDLYSSPAIERQQSMIKWRELAQEECKELIKTVGKKADSAGVDKKEALERAFVNKIKMNPEPSTISASKTEPYRRCKNAFIDLGTNIGDSIGYFIDNSVDVCSLMWVDANPDTKFDNKFPRPHLDVATLEFKHRGSKPNPLYGLLQRTMKKSPQATSETFCVYGMEGNPVFTERLTKLENFVSDMNPRPVQHLHIFTESVVTATNGPTKLFLDKLSEKHNFWGSSILSSQQDAVKSGKELNGGDVFSADVTGITLSTIVESTMLALDEDASKENKKGGVLIVKMDVEGAEYQVLKEVAASGVLCKLKESGNRVVMVVEYHNMSITDKEERNREKNGHKAAVQKLKECGVEFENLAANWA